MIFEATVIIFFILIGVAAVALGHYAQRHELYIFGVLLIFFMGLIILDEGMAVQTGVTVNETSSPSGNDTIISTTQTYAYDRNKDAFTNGLGLLCVVIAGGLALTWLQAHKERKEKKKQSIELDD